MSEDYKDLAARFILIFFAILFIILIVGLGVWPLFAVSAGVMLSIYSIVWAMVRLWG